MKTLASHKQPFFDLLENPPSDVKQRYQADIVYYMGIDAEWYEELGRNVVLSYQVATISRTSGNNIIKYVQKGVRLRLSDLVELGIKSVNGGELPSCHDGARVMVVLVSHNVAAEWSVLADRDEPYITKRLALVRRSPITDIHPIEVLLDRRISARVLLFDTMLLAPATHQSLKKLSGLLGKDDHKVPITQHQIENMHLYLRDDPKGYREYALKDSEACLKLFLLLQDGLNKLVYGMERGENDEYRVRADYQPLKLFRTLASAGVRSFEEHLELSVEAETFRQHHPDFQAYQKALRSPPFDAHMELVKRSYLGGRNESYFVGDTEKYDLSHDRLWIDIDFNSCYPTAMALYPMIDTSKRVRCTPPRHRIDPRTASRMEQENIPRSIIDKAQGALTASEEEFHRYLGTIKSKALAARTREMSQVVDNRLINRWRRIASGSLKAAEMPPESFIIPGFAKVRFRFPMGTTFPCLPIKHVQFGLIYPLEGETVATASEILLALECGAKIETLYSVEFPMMLDEEGRPVRLFAPHLATVVQERVKKKALSKDESLSEEDRIAASVMEKLLKEFANGLYGKTAQAINDRNVFRPSKRTMVSLGPSSITEPVVASLCTGLARAALSASLVAVERYNRTLPEEERLVAISATTDGMLIGAPRPADLQTAAEYYRANEDGNLELNKGVDESLDSLLARCGCAAFADEMQSFLPIHQMRQGRKVLTGSNREGSGMFLEVKHLVDRVVSVKTRGQIGLLHDERIPLLAKFGHKPPLSEEIDDPEEYKRVMEAGGTTRNKADGDWILKQLEEIEEGDGEIPTYTFFTLTSFRSMVDSDGTGDMVGKKTQRKFNADYDWKRKLSLDSPVTSPYQSIREMKVYRNQMEGVRRSGKVAHSDKVHQRVAIKGRKTRFRGGELATLTRLFLRGVLQGHIPLGGKRPSYVKVAEGLNLLWEGSGYNDKERRRWTASDLKNAKTDQWEAGIIPRSLPALTLLEELCSFLNADHQVAARLLFISQEHEEHRHSLIVQVARSVLLGPRQGIEPFRTFYLAGKLPDRKGVRTIFTPYLTDDTLKRCSEGTFARASRPNFDHPRLVALYRQIGLTAKESNACATVLAPPEVRERAPRLPRHRKRCLDLFVQALSQPDIHGHKLKSQEIINRLSSFGLTPSRYYSARRGKFTAHSLTDTAENRQQIWSMAKRLKLSSAPFIEALIDG